MLPKANRLPSPFIRSVLRNGQRIHRGPFTLYIATNENGTARLAIIVPGAIDKRSTVRNRIKRQLREALRSLLPEISPDWDIVIRVRAVIENDSSKVDNLIQQVLASGNVLRHSS